MIGGFDGIGVFYFFHVGGGGVLWGLELCCVMTGFVS